MLNLILTIVIDLALLWSGVYLGFVIFRFRYLRVYKALDAIMDHYGPEGMEDKLYLQGFIAINDYLGRKPNCASCKYLTEWDCAAPDDALNSDGFCTGWKARKKSLAILHGIKIGLKNHLIVDVEELGKMLKEGKWTNTQTKE